MSNIKRYRILKECGLYYIQTSKDNFKTCISIGVSDTREKAETKMKTKQYHKIIK